MNTGERWRYKLKRSRDTTATLISMEWTSPETSSANLSRNGTLWSKLSFKQRLLMDICWESSPLASQEELVDKSELLATLRTLKRRLFVKRWWKLWLLKPKNLPWRSWPRNSFKRTSANKLQRSAARFSLFKTSWLKSSNFSRSLSLISPNSWSSIKRDLKLRREEKRKLKKEEPLKKRSPRTF